MSALVLKLLAKVGHGEVHQDNVGLLHMRKKLTAEERQVISFTEKYEEFRDNGHGQKECGPGEKGPERTDTEE